MAGFRSPERYAAVRALADRVRELLPSERIAIAVDGVDGAGKTVLADELAGLLVRERDVVRVSIDGFHRPRSERYRNGTGPESFYRDSYDYDAFRAAVLDPFRRGEPVTPAVNDVEQDLRIEVPAVPVGEDSVLVVDGIFLQRPGLADVWDGAIFVDVPFEVSVPRGNARFPGAHDPDPEASTNRRYVDGQRLYVAEARPRERATWVFDNTDLDRPRLTVRADA
ncbi:MAG: uridine kinase [Intrasporangium sp.]|uniref:uridine kinase n=1 Tax=Intrasporangium sp. TaxID=1925024 RepID=UPI003F7F7F2B